MKINVKSILKKEKRDWIKLAKQNKVPQEIIDKVKAKKNQEIKGV